MSYNTSIITPKDSCSCDYCTRSAAAAAAPTAKRRKSPYDLETSAALLRVGNNQELVTRRAEGIHQFFSASYQKKKGFNYLQACEAAEGALSGEFSANAKIRHYSAYSIKPHYLRDYDKPEHHYKRAMLLREAGDKGKEAFIEKTPLSLVETHTLRAAQISADHEAREFFKDRPYAIAISRRSTERRKDVPYFLHYEKSSTVPGDSIILPLEYKSIRKWSTRSAREEQKEMQPQREIKGLHPIYEMLQPYHEEGLLHPTREHSLGNSTRHLPMDCKKWDCSVCMSLMKFNEPIKYVKFLGC